MALTYHDLIMKSCDTVAWLLRMRLNVTGQENLVDQPTIYVPNHFTRLETALMPYVVQKARGSIPHTLGMHGLFEGAGGRFLQSVGVMSVKHPHRNRMIIRQLITHAHDWVIYAEGGLIKNKKTVRNGRQYLEHPAHAGPPHTGAALLALKAEISRQRYLQACADEDMLRREFYEKEFGLRHPKQICTQPVVLQPVSISFHPLRASDTIISRLMAKVSRNMNAKLLEEVAFESSLLLKRASINIHFGEAVSADQYLDLPRTVVRRIMSRYAEHRHAAMLLRRQARRYTNAVMHSVYTGIEINCDHLLATALREREIETIDEMDVRRALLLAVRTITADGSVRLHKDVRDGITQIVTNAEYEPYIRAMHLAQQQKIVQQDGSTLTINTAKLCGATDFDSIRLTNTVQVLANEVEPIRLVLRAVRQFINLPSSELQRRVAQILHTDSIRAFDSECAQCSRNGANKPAELVQPFLLEHSHAHAGVVLVHGYLASPQQMRPLAEYLHGLGYNVYSVRLPSHGTAPGQLSDVHWSAWLNAVRHGYCLLQQSCTQVLVGGISLGGVLAMLLAASPDVPPAGVFAINPPLQLRDRRAALVPSIMRMRRALTSVGIHRPPARLIASNTETPEMSYAHHPLASIQQVRAASSACRQRLDAITSPLLLIQGDHDPVVVPEAAQRALRSVSSDLRLLTMLPFDRHNIVDGDRKELVFHALHRFLIRVTGESETVRPISGFRWRRRLARAGFIRTLGLGVW